MIQAIKCFEEISQKSSCMATFINPLSTNPTKWSNTLKQFVGYGHKAMLSITTFFISNAFISNTRLKLAKNSAKAKQHLEAELLAGRK